ncbi:MAG: lytic murein transglycosylase [Thiobacillaceae bacterium]|nr:lytic murein transglycosylase [Thiobacillaceae bacterium]
MRNGLRTLLLLATLATPLAQAQPTDFQTWLAAFRQDAAAQGISAATLDSALTGVTPVEQVIELDRRQPEFLQTFLAYLERRTTPRQIERGQALLAEHADLLDAVEQQYGIPKTVLVAFWGLETNYGAYLGGFNIPACLATLAFDGRRSAFFRKELLDALRIIDAGHVEAIEMNGSWAGAMGQMQFMPSTFRAYAVDGDGDSRIDLWNSLPDAMYSAANYLLRAGWRAGEPIALEVRLPEGFDLRRAGMNNVRPLSDWQALGVEAAAAHPPLASSLRGALVLPQGWQGPVFMVFTNFSVVMQWNRSVNYALSVAHLADRLQGGGPLAGGQLAEREALSREQLMNLQQQLGALGFDAGTPDGVVGPRTRGAIWLYQVTHGLPPDGYPAPSLLSHVQQAYDTAAALGRLVIAPALSPDSD